MHHGLSQFEEILVQQAEAKRQSRNGKLRELDKGQIVFVFSVEGMVTPKLALSATLDAVPRPPFRACFIFSSCLVGKGLAALVTPPYWCHSCTTSTAMIKSPYTGSVQASKPQLIALIR